MSKNQFQVLSESESTKSQSQVQGEDNLINPRSTRLQRLRVARRTEGQRILFKERVSEIVIPQNIDDPTFFDFFLFV